MPLQRSWNESCAVRSGIALTHCCAAHQLLAKEMPDSSFPPGLGSCEVSPKGCHPPDDVKGSLDDIKGLPLELSFPCLQQDQCLSCRVCSCGSVVALTCYTPCTLQEKIEKVEFFCAKGKNEGGGFRDVLPTPEVGWGITTVSTVLLSMSLHQNFGASRLLPACRFDRAPLLCVPVQPQHCHPCFGTVVVGAVGVATNGSTASG